MTQGFRIEITALSPVPGQGTARCPGMERGFYQLNGWYRRPDGSLVVFFKQPGESGPRSRLGARNYHGAVYTIARIEPVEFPTDPPEAFMDAPVVPRDCIEGDYRIAQIYAEEMPGRGWRLAEHKMTVTLRHLAYEHGGTDLVQPRRGRRGHFEVPIVEMRRR